MYFHLNSVFLNVCRFLKIYWKFIGMHEIEMIDISI